MAEMYISGDCNTECLHLLFILAVHTQKKNKLL